MVPAKAGTPNKPPAHFGGCAPDASHGGTRAHLEWSSLRVSGESPHADHVTDTEGGAGRAVMNNHLVVHAGLVSPCRFDTRSARVLHRAKDVDQVAAADWLAFRFHA